MSAEKMQYLWHIPRRNTAESAGGKKKGSKDTGREVQRKSKISQNDSLNSTLSMFSWKAVESLVEMKSAKRLATLAPQSRGYWYPARMRHLFHIKPMLPTLVLVHLIKLIMDWATP